MTSPGFDRSEREAVAGPGPDVPDYVERRSGESNEQFEARLAAAADAAERGYTASTRQAYADGRRDQHRADRARRRRGFGLAGLLVVVIAAVGVLWLVLAAREGSFAAGGAVVDQKLAEVTNPARVAANQAVDRTGAAVQNAGQTLETQGERLRETAR